MTQREIANLCCRVLAVYAFLQATPIVAILVQWLATYGQAGSAAFPSIWQSAIWMVQPLLMGLAGILLWRKSWIVAALMVGHDLQDAPDEPDQRRTSATAAGIHAIAFSTVGVWILAVAVPELAGTLAYLGYSQWLSQNHAVARDFTSSNASRTFMECVLRIIVGVYLLFGASGLVKLLRDARNFGLLENERPEYVRRIDSESQEKISS